MPTEDDLDFLAMAREMIAEAGRTVTFGVLAATNPDPDRPWKGGTAIPTLDPSFSIPIVQLPDQTLGLIGGSGLGRMDIIETGLFKTSELIVLVAHPDDPDADEFIRCNVMDDTDGSRWRIHARKVANPGDTAIFYAIGLIR